MKSDILQRRHWKLTAHGQTQHFVVGRHDGAVETTSGLYCIRDVIETYTVYLNPIDPAIGNMTIEVLNPDGELIYQQGIGEHLTFTLDIDETAVGDYRFEVVVPEGSPPREQTYQYLMVMEPGNLVNPDSFSEQANKLLVDPSVQAYAIGLLSFRNPNPAALIVLIMNYMLYEFTNLERYALRFIDMPFGSSLIMIAQKQA